jgi:hypothetical protein
MRAGVLVLACVAGGCLQAPQYECSDDTVCVLNNVQGSCHVPTSTCVYPGPGCESDLRDGHGNCVESIGMGGTDDVTSNSGSMTSLSSTTTVDPDDSSTSSEASTTTPVSETSTTSGTVECDGSASNITDLGVVGASTVFEGYPPILSADGDFSTSWFSTGPEAGPTAYLWTLNEERCIAQIKLTGNALHSNPAFREDFGFGSVTVKVLDRETELVFQQTWPLDGTPDPEVTVATGGVMGSRVVLEFTGHENNDCGGFSELEVLGE